MCGGGGIKKIESYPSVSLTSNSHLPGPMDINCSRIGQQWTIRFLLNPIRRLSAAFGVCAPRSEAASRRPSRTVNKKLAASKEKIHSVIRLHLQLLLRPCAHKAPSVFGQRRDDSGGRKDPKLIELIADLFIKRPSELIFSVCSKMCLPVWRLSSDEPL